MALSTLLHLSDPLLNCLCITQHSSLSYSQQGSQAFSQHHGHPFSINDVPSYPQGIHLPYLLQVCQAALVALILGLAVPLGKPAVPSSSR